MELNIWSVVLIISLSTVKLLASIITTHTDFTPQYNQICRRFKVLLLFIPICAGSIQPVMLCIKFPQLLHVIIQFLLL